MTSHLIKTEQCPRCYNEGRDRSGDNLGVYSDGHKYCFRCELYVPSNSIRRIISDGEESGRKQGDIFLPVDSSFEYPNSALQWCGRYYLDRNTLLSHRVLWSESRQRLVFPIFSDRTLLGHVGRYFGKEPLTGTKRKWDSRGDLKNILHFIGRSDKRIIIVEDIVSAIRVSKFGIGLPVFGSHVGIDRFKRIARTQYGDLQCVIWLDPDMHIKIIKESNLGASMGLKTRSILSDKDPKEYTDKEICNILA